MAEGRHGEKPMDEVLDTVSEIIERHGYRDSSLLAVLQEIQEEFRFLPRKALLQVARTLDIPLTRIYGVATFYKALSLEPRGRHTIRVCLGTACHVRGGAKILDFLENRLHLQGGGTTKDLRFSLESVNCVGACALGPLVIIDNHYHGNVRLGDVESILEEYG